MFKKFIFLLLTVAIFGVVGSYFYLNAKNPVREGELRLEGLSQSVNVLYDNYGIPHITAKNNRDLYRAFGYVHAQDRLFQMEMSRRLSQGRLSEILGQEFVGVDKLFKTLGLEHFAKQWITAINKRADPNMLTIMQSYLDGVNQYMANGSTPIEFELIGIPAHQYTLEDMASIAGFMSFSFAQGLRDDPLLSHLSQKLGENYLKDMGILYTPGFEQIPVDPIMTKSLSIEVSQIVENLQFSGLFHGSNSWLIAPKRSESGRAILVNDPHIGFSQPSVWYEAHLTTDSMEIYGHFLGLVPVPMLGMTKEHAWGLTMFENDDMDLYVEKLNPENSDQYWAIDHWQDFEKRAEVIKVKDSEDVILELLTTRHGTVVNHIYDEIDGGKYGLDKVEQPIALWWAFQNTDNQMMEAFYHLTTATTLEKAQKSAEMIHAPGLNLMYANSNGDIAWWASAKLPIRPVHVNPKFILDGASGKDDILGFYDFSHNPQQVNPASGILYTANNQPANMGDGLVPGYYAPTDRPTRIAELLAKKEKFNPEDMKKMLMDNTTLSAKFFQQIAGPILQSKLLALNEIETQALKYFVSWQGNHSSTEIGATIYNRFRINLMRLIMMDEIGEELYDNFQFGFLMDRSIWHILDNEESLWWDNIDTKELETREQLVVQTWHQTIRFLQNRFGNDVAQWSWKNDIKMVHEHPLGKISPLDKFFNVGPLTSEAGVEAINNLMFKSDGDELKIIVGPSTRRVIDFGDIENSWGINPTGQSGVVTDLHYQDQAIDYSKGNFRHHWISQQQIQDHLESVLTLMP